MALHRSMEKKEEQAEQRGERGEGSGRDSSGLLLLGRLGGGTMEGAGMAKAKGRVREF